MTTEKTDAKLDNDSSSLSDVQANAGQQQGANKGAEDVKIDTSVDVKKGTDFKSIAEQIKAKYAAKDGAKDGASADEKTASKADATSPVDSQLDADVSKKESALEDSSVLKQNETPEQKTDRESKEKMEAASTPDEKLPFHKHPRFQQVITERNEFERQISEYKPAADRMAGVEKFCRDNNVPAADYDESIRLAALTRSNPTEALTRFKKIVENLEVQTGSALPQDLQKRVDDGGLALTDAQELAKARLEKNQATYQAKAVEATAAERAEKELVSSLDAWTQAKIKSDPSFKPKGKGSEDGKYELVTDKFLALWQQNPPRNVSDAVALVESAYKNVHDFIERTMPRPAQRRPLSQKTSDQVKDEPVDIRKPGWAKEVAKRTLAKYS